MTYYFIDDFDNICRQKDGMDKDFAEIIDLVDLIKDINKLTEENHKIKSILLKKVEELNDAYDKSAKVGMPTGGIIGELDSFEEICRIMEWIE